MKSLTLYVIENYDAFNILCHSVMQEEVPEFVDDDKIEESDISDMEVTSKRTFSNVDLIVISYSNSN